MNGGDRSTRGFHLEIHSLEDFREFCTILRGTEGEAEKVDALAQRLRVANDTEAATVAANTPTP